MHDHQATDVEVDVRDFSTVLDVYLNHSTNIVPAHQGFGQLVVTGGSFSKDIEGGHQMYSSFVSRCIGSAN